MAADTAPQRREHSEGLSIDFLRPDDLTLSSEEAITCEALDLLITGGSRLLRTLRILAHDLELTRRGIEPVFGLDFSELHSFLWPDEAGTYRRNTIRACLQAKHLNYTVPPGATVELIQQLYRLSQKNRSLHRAFEHFAQNRLVSAFVDAFRTSKSPDLQRIILQGNPELRRAIEVLMQAESTLTRTSQLLGATNLVPFAHYLEDLDEPILPDLDVLHEALTSLQLHRPSGRERNNYVDAHNYAYLWTLSNRQAMSAHRLFFFVTSSPITYYVLSRTPWDSKTATLVNPQGHRYSLVRHPIHVLHYAFVAPLGDSGRAEIDAMIRELDTLLKAWSNIALYERYKLNREQFRTRIIRMPRSTTYLRSAMQFRARYNSLLGRVRRIIETDVLADENIRQFCLFGPWSTGSSVFGSLEEYPGTTSIRNIFELFDRATRNALEVIAKLGGTLAGVPDRVIAAVDHEGIVFRRKQSLKVEKTENERFGCLEVSAFDKTTHMQFLGCDVFSDFVSLWWPTRSTFVEFVQAVKFLLFRMHKLKLKQPARRKHYDGIYLYKADSDRPIKATLEDCADLTPDSLLALADRELISMIRIANTHADVCYDFEPFGLLSQRIGIATHAHGIAEPIAEFVQTTNEMPLNRREINRVVREVFDAAQETWGRR